MSRIPATARALKGSASRLRRNADDLDPGEGALLLLFYSVECGMKERYLVRQLAKPYGDTSLIPLGTFGDSGHDLDAGRKALRAPASLPAAPSLRVSEDSVAVNDCHQVWRYGIKHSGAEALEAWLKSVASWLEASR